MGTRFKGDVVKLKCSDGEYRNAIITGLRSDGTFDVAYIKSFDCKDVEVFKESDVKDCRVKGATLDDDTILPYEEGDLVKYFLSEDHYYMAHIVKVGPVDTVTILLGDLYMNEMVKDRK